MPIKVISTVLPRGESIQDVLFIIVRVVFLINLEG